MASSAFERYLRTITTTAIESDPLLTPGWPKHVDGLLLKNRGIPTPPRRVEGITKGGWTQRASAYRTLFKLSPAALIDNLSELDSIRRIRNLVAHEFGADASADLSSSTLLLSISRRHSRPRTASVSHHRLIKWLGVFNTVARAVDDHLTNDFIGAYELAAIFLEWRADPDRFEQQLNVVMKSAKRTNESRFSSAIGAFVPPFGREYESGLRQYVDKL